MNKRLIILDPGYEHLESHHHTVNQSIITAYSDTGIAIKVYAGKNLSTAIQKLQLQNIFYLQREYCDLLESQWHALNN